MERACCIGKGVVKQTRVWCRSFGWISEPRFDEANGWTISISSRRAINVNEYRGRPSVSIREYAKLDSGEVVPTKKGIFLTEENYTAVVECEGVVKQLIEKVKKGETK